MVDLQIRSTPDFPQSFCWRRRCSPVPRLDLTRLACSCAVAEGSHPWHPRAKERKKGEKEKQRTWRGQLKIRYNEMGLNHHTVYFDISWCKVGACRILIFRWLSARRSLALRSSSISKSRQERRKMKNNELLTTAASCELHPWNLLSQQLQHRRRLRPLQINKNEVSPLHWPPLRSGEADRWINLDRCPSCGEKWFGHKLRDW